MVLRCQCGGNPIVLLLIIAGLWLLFNWIMKSAKAKGDSMNKLMKILIIAVLLLAVAIVVAVKQKEQSLPLQPAAQTNPAVETSAADAQQPRVSEASTTLPNTEFQHQPLPRLVELGADKCIPCKMMKPILDELAKEYRGKFKVEFLDVWKNPAYGREYNIRVIPTQIFFDADGKELFRHEGFFSKEDILAKWQELGFEFKLDN